jgi:hypothetical protein
LQPRFWTDPGSPAPNRASTAAGVATVSAVSRSPLRHALTRVVAASCGDDVAPAGIAVVAVVDTVVDVVVLASTDCELGAETVGDSLSELQATSSSAPARATARYICST